MREVFLFITTIAFILIGFVIYRPFLEISLSLITNENIQLDQYRINGGFYSKLYFSVLMGYIPVTYYLIQKKTNIHFFTDGLYIVLCIIGCCSVSWVLRCFYLSDKFKDLSIYDLNSEKNPSFSIENFYLELYLLFGFLIGAIISFIIFKRKEKKLT